MASYIPPYRVDLQQWCDWTGDEWSKISSVVGQAFRMRGPNENTYTMAATAVMRLIDQYQIDPNQIGYLALGTESSTDNSAGAVLVRGMLDDALVAAGRPAIARECEVPEFKHACLGGVYALKAALRYLQTDGRDKLAIVVCSDVAEYARGTSGEPTQGAGAVAMLLDGNASLASIDLTVSGSSSAYRGPDFRKPLSRFIGQTASQFAQPRDFPVFNGKYSTSCYLDAALTAGRDLFQSVAGSPAQWLRSLAMIYLHRPYQRMAENGLAYLYLLALAVDESQVSQDELQQYAEQAGVDATVLVAELQSTPDLHALVSQGNLGVELFPATAAAARVARKAEVFAGLLTTRGSDSMQDVGNLYTASLPAWMAAGIEQAHLDNVELAGQRVLAAGYGSGDAAELLVLEFAPQWQEAAAHLGFADSLNATVAVSREDYEALHDGVAMTGVRRPGVFYIDHVGDGSAQFDDTGIEYYGYQR